MGELSAAADGQQRLSTASNEALIRRALQGGAFYPVIMAFLIAVTDWRSTHVTLAGSMLAVTTAASAIRFAYLERLLAEPARYAQRSPRGISLALLLPTAAYGVFTAASFVEFGLANMTSVMANLAMLGIAAGGTSSLAMNRRAHMRFLLTLVAPLAGVAAFTATSEGFTIVLMLMLNLVFLGREGKAANTAFVGLVEKSFELAAANDSMKLVLDNIGQGLCVVDATGCIGAHSSRAFETWFGVARPGTPLGEQLGDPDLAAWFELAFATLAVQGMPVDVAIAQLPSVTSRDGKTFSLAYKPILQAERFVGLVVVVNDVTERLLAEASDREQRELVQLFQLLARDPEGLALFRASADALVRGLVAPGVARGEQLRALHTLKGNAAVMGIDTIATLCHVLEDELVDTTAELDADQIARLVEAWRQTEARLASMLGDRDAAIDLSAAEHDQLIAMIDAGVRHDVLARYVRDWHLESVPRQFERMALQAKRIAQGLGRDIRVKVDVPPLRLDAGRWQELWMACIHLMRNSLDHGIEDSSTRAALGKQTTGQLLLSARREGADVVVTVGDDGHGIDWSRVREKASALGLPTDTDAALRDALLSDGVSTRDQVTELSGRGVGLGAVAHLTHRMGGVIEIASTMGQGTEFTIRVPDYI